MISQEMIPKEISRFVSRLVLPENAKFEVKKLQILSEPKPGYVELYHAIMKDYPTQNIDPKIKSILTNGFYPSMRGNKTEGVYFANHAMYSYKWAGYNSPVLICSIEPGDYIKRFRSEVNSKSIHDSEYVITNPSKITVNYILEYKIELGEIEDATDFDNIDFDNTIYIRHGHFGCTTCDPKIIRCDCEQFPNIDPLDIVG